MRLVDILLELLQNHLVDFPEHLCALLNFFDGVVCFNALPHRHFLLDRGGALSQPGNLLFEEIFDVIVQSISDGLSLLFGLSIDCLLFASYATGNGRLLFRVGT